MSEKLKFKNLREAFDFFGIENYNFGSNKTKALKLSEYCIWHRVNKFSIIVDEIYEKKKNLYSKRTGFSQNDLKDNFLNIVKAHKGIPLYSDFCRETNISINSYANILGLKTTIYDTIVNLYIDNKDMLNDYYLRKKNHKHIESVRTGSMAILYTDEMIEQNFKYIFDSYFIKYNTYPPRELFDKISPYDSSLYRKRLNISWTEVIKKYGYTPIIKNKSEDICISMCDKILGEKSIRQKIFSWLHLEGSNYKMRCDSYYENLNLVIEFDGAAHRIPIKKFGGVDGLNRCIERDRTKDKLLNEHGITVIRIDSRSKWYDEDWLRQYILGELTRLKCA